MHSTSRPEEYTLRRRAHRTKFTRASASITSFGNRLIQACCPQDQGLSQRICSKGRKCRVASLEGPCNDVAAAQFWLCGWVVIQDVVLTTQKMSQGSSDAQGNLANHAVPGPEHGRLRATHLLVSPVRSDLTSGLAEAFVVPEGTTPWIIIQGYAATH